MTAAVKSLLDMVMRLRAEEQLELLDALNLHVAAHNQDDFPAPAWHEAVIEQRLAELESSPEEGTPAEEVYAELLARLQLTRP